MPSVEQSVLYMKVTDALRERTPDRIAALSKTYNIADFQNLLSLAVELSPLETVQWTVKLYETKGKSFNEADPQTGDTALHKAVALGRADVVRELMMIPSLDDTIRNKQGLTAPELASTPEMEHAVSSSENKFAGMMAVRLKAAFRDHDLSALSQIYANPRVAEILNINGIDPDTGRNVLHDAAAANDLRIVQFILAHGGDPLIRDRATQKLPQDLSSNDEIRRALNNAAKSKAILDQTHGKTGAGATKTAPAMEGYLKKWTNITSGYKLRWFELKNGELCYFKRPEDTKGGDRFIRGSISLRRAAVRLDSSEKNKFEIRTPSTRFHLKASHPAETNKWVWALQNAITWSRDEEKQKATGAGAGATGAGAGTAVASAGAGAGAVGGAAAGTGGGASHKKQPSLQLNTPSQQAPQSPQTPQSPQASQASHASQGSHQKQLQSAASLDHESVGRRADSASTTGSFAGGQNELLASLAAMPFQPGSYASNPVSSPGRRTGSLGGQSDGEGWLVNDLNKGDDDDSDDDYADEAALREPQIHAESLISRLSAIKDLMTMLVFQVQDETMRDAITTAQGSIDVLSSDIVMFERQANAHIHIAKVELERSDKGQRSWASNYRDLEVQYHQLEARLHALMSKTGNDDEDEDDEFFDTVDFAPPQEKSGPASGSSSSSGTHKIKDSIAGAAAGIASAVGMSSSKSDSHKADSHKAGSAPTSAADTSAVDTPVAGTSAAGTSAAGTSASSAPGTSDTSDSVRRTSSNGPSSAKSASSEAGASASSEKHGNVAAAGAVGAAGAGAAGAGAAGAGAEAKENKDNDKHANSEHGESGESGKEQPKEPSKEQTEAQLEVARRIDEEKSFAGYEDPPRQKLKLDADNRPKLSLWGILKNLVGKDMTKMSLPVTFNECTSLLQRSAEDMEYVDLLDHAAAATDDGGLRMAYVAAFAGSSYSSTINRIAKPFNPLLGETYEYARPDMGYRLFAEQVSHHPPIGALMAEADKWDFYGESNVESKFYGRSFDINPLGLWYINLRPNKGADVAEELYSFRKLTSSVVGIMLGNPVVDNYGDMKITNHTTGINAVISYKARGWRAASAYKLQGKIMDKNGKLLWTMEGQWNDKMYAKKAGSDESVLLWEIHPRHKVPFNLTDFAVTLNALPDRLKPWLPPTDTRLRPDQRAMEEGRYDDASDEKNRVENKQREKRRERETSGQKYTPQWFTLEKHPVTGLDYYKPINHYWGQRAHQELADKGDIF